MNSNQLREKILQDAKNSLANDFYNNTSITTAYVQQLYEQKRSLEIIAAHLNLVISIYEEVVERRKG